MKLTLPWPPSMNTAGIYKITDTKSGRYYIGSTVNIRKRMAYHLYRLTKGTHPNRRLQNIFNKRPDSLIGSVIEFVERDKNALLLAEQGLLDTHVGNALCMNYCKTAGSQLGVKRSNETKDRLSKAFTGRVFSSETKTKMRNAKAGVPLSIEHRKKIGAKSKGRPGPVHTKENIEKWRKLNRDQVSSVFEMKARKFGTPRIAKAIGASRATVRRILAGESYL